MPIWYHSVAKRHESVKLSYTGMFNILENVKSVKIKHSNSSNYLYSSKKLIIADSHCINLPSWSIKVKLYLSVNVPGLKQGNHL